MAPRIAIGATTLTTPMLAPPTAITGQIGSMTALFIGVGPWWGWGWGWGWGGHGWGGGVAADTASRRIRLRSRRIWTRRLGRTWWIWRTRWIWRREGRARTHCRDHRGNQPRQGRSLRQGIAPALRRPCRHAISLSACPALLTFRRSSPRLWQLLHFLFRRSGAVEILHILTAQWTMSICCSRTTNTGEPFQAGRRGNRCATDARALAPRARRATPVRQWLIAHSGDSGLPAPPRFDRRRGLVLAAAAARADSRAPRSLFVWTWQGLGASGARPLATGPGSG